MAANARPPARLRAATLAQLADEWHGNPAGCRCHAQCSRAAPAFGCERLSLGSAPPWMRPTCMPPRRCTGMTRETSRAPVPRWMRPTGTPRSRPPRAKIPLGKTRQPRMPGRTRRSPLPACRLPRNAAPLGRPSRADFVSGHRTRYPLKSPSCRNMSLILLCNAVPFFRCGTYGGHQAPRLLRMRRKSNPKNPKLPSLARSTC